MTASKSQTQLRAYSAYAPSDERFRIGAVRDTFNKNEVIIKQNPRLARVVNRGFDLPRSKTFVYGHKNQYLDGGVAAAIKHDLEFKSEIKIKDPPPLKGV